MMSSSRVLSRAYGFTLSKMTGQRGIANLPQVHATRLAVAQNTDHVRDVDQTLKTSGIIKIGLQFDDDHCTYLEQLLHQLHKNHGHGPPISHSASRGCFWDVRPQQDKILGTPQARSETMNQFPWHTDCSYELSPPRYFALQVIHPDECGGGTLSVLDASRLVSYLSPIALQALGKPEFRIDVPPEFIKNEKKTSIVGNLLWVNKLLGTAQLRFREDIVTPLTPSAAIAFEELRQTLKDAKLQSEVMNLSSEMLPRGSIIAIDNRRWLHGRNEVLDPNRHLRRVRWDAQPFPKL